MAQVMSGGCACGAIRFDVSGAPKFSFVCHCRACQQLTGTGHAVAVTFDETDFAVTGEVSVFEREAASGNKVAQHFCQACGSPLYNRPARAPGLVMINIGAFDAPNSLAPTRVFHESDAAEWDQVPWHDYSASGAE